MNRIVSLAAVFVSALALGSVACAPVEGDDGESFDTTASELGLAAPEPAPLVIKCVTKFGEEEVTEEQCKKLLTISGCKPGAVVGDKMKCSTTSREPIAPPTSGELAAAPAPEPTEAPDDFASAPERDPSLVKCITNAGEFEVTEEQCRKLLTIAGCKPGAVLGDKMKCSTT